MRIKVKIYLLLISCFFSQHLLSCEKTDLFEFGQYSQKMYDDEAGVKWEESHGESVSESGDKIQINLSFLDKLIEEPTGENLEKNREELIYLISSGNDQATKAGLLVLNHLLENPKYSYECESKYELFGKEELAFSLGRSGKAYKAFCSLDDDSLLRVLNYYEKYPKLWGLIFDQPWLHQNLECHPHNKSLKSDAASGAA